MSHTTIMGKTTFIHNGDFTGDLLIKTPDDKSIVVPADDILAMVAYHIRDRKISKLENQDWHEVLNDIIKQ